MIIGIAFSLLSCLWNTAGYHIVSDGETSEKMRQLGLMPYYAVHFLFRSLCMAAFFIYWQVTNLIVLQLAVNLQEFSVFIFFVPIFFNMRLTKKTYRSVSSRKLSE
jgi:hypothetical protein